MVYILVLVVVNMAVYISENTSNYIYNKFCIIEYKLYSSSWFFKKLNSKRQP